jgi:predicted dehydrogenase
MLRIKYTLRRYPRVYQLAKRVYYRWQYRHAAQKNRRKLHMTDTINWGIIGTGNIASKFAEGLSALDDAALVAVGSRNQQTADAFAAQFGVPNAHTSYEALANDPDVDAIYVSSPHPFHKTDAIMCLNAGKPVLCEKPFTLNARDTEAVVNVARQKGLFLMEAMWTRFLPTVVKVRELLAANAIGEVRMVTADFGFRFDGDDEHRLLNPHLGGGALLDVGIYPVSFASMVYGTQPTRMTTQAVLGHTGVDELGAILFQYDGGHMASLYTTLQIDTPQEATIVGTQGRIRLESPFWSGEVVTLSKPGKDDNVMQFPFVGNGYNYEAAEVAKCLRAGKLESDTMPLDESIEIMHTMDTIRAEWGLVYPGE